MTRYSHDAACHVGTTLLVVCWGTVC